MTIKKKNPMPRAMYSALGGGTHSREHMAMLGSRGAAANLAKNGTSQPKRAALMRWYPESFGQAKGPRGNGSLKHSQEGQSE